MLSLTDPATCPHLAFLHRALPEGDTAHVLRSALAMPPCAPRAAREHLACLVFDTSMPFIPSVYLFHCHLFPLAPLEIAWGMARQAFVPIFHIINIINESTDDAPLSFIIGGP